MNNPLVYFEIGCRDKAATSEFYSKLFEWTIGPDGLIAESKGHFDEAEYQRQLKSGAPPAR